MEGVVWPTVHHGGEAMRCEEMTSVCLHQEVERNTGAQSTVSFYSVPAPNPQSGIATFRVNIPPQLQLKKHPLKANPKVFLQSDSKFSQGDNKVL